MSLSVINTSHTRDAELADLIDRLTARLKAGEAPDLDDLLQEHPEHADELRQLFPSVRMLADLSHRAMPCRMATTWPPLGELGDYSLIREVGRGGMGVVYEAQQVSLRRQVALKVLPWAAAMDPKQLQRFKNEALAAASLKHDHIVSVYAVGCERGVHYYAMEFVEGQTLSQFIAHRAGLRERPENVQLSATGPYLGALTQPRSPETAPIAALSTRITGSKGREFYRRAAQLIADAADALEHAHALGIVHRDIKPGNLLLDAAGKLYVSDFGLARFGPDAGLTMSGDLLGTLRYMAPEQALARHGLADHRVDVYGLGCTLYELLTGRPAVGGDDKADIVRRIAFEEPVALRKVDKAIPAELETITLKCLTKNPNERYATAGELAEDLRRWLGDQVIKAKPPGVRERMAKWGRRHRAFVQASVAMLIFAVIGLGVSTWLVWREKQTAEQRDSETKAVLEFVESRIFAAARPKDRGGLGHDVSLRHALEAAVPFVEISFINQPLIEAQLRKTLGISFRVLGEYRIEAEQFQAVRTIYTKHLGRDHRDTLKSMHYVALSYCHLGQDADACKLQEETLALRKNKFGHDDADTLESMENLADIYEGLGRYADALKLSEETLTVRKTKLGLAHSDTQRSLYQLGQFYYAHRNDALKLSEETLALLKARPPSDGFEYTLLGRHDEAVKLNEQYLASIKEACGPDHPRLLPIMNNLANNYSGLGRHADALKLREETLALHKAMNGPVHTDMLKAMNNLACSYSDLGRHADAVKLSEEALALSNTELGPSHPLTFALMSNLAFDLATCPDTKLRDTGRAVELAKSAVVGAPNDATCWNQLGVVYYRAGDWKAAVTALEKSMELDQKGDSLDRFYLAMAYWQLGDKDKARTSYDQGVQWMDKNKSQNEDLRRSRAEAAEFLNKNSGVTHPK